MFKFLQKEEKEEVKEDKKVLDNLFISSGAMKTSTTWMYRVLNTHPELYFCPEKEIHYFAHIMGDENQILDLDRRVAKMDQYLRIPDPVANSEMLRYRLRWLDHYLSEPLDDKWYQSIFSLREGEKYCCDFSNLSCHMKPEDWREIKQKVANLKVIYTMRDPIQRLWSHAKFHAKFIGQRDSIQDWDKDFADELMRKRHMWKNAEYGQIVRNLKAGLAEDELEIFFFENVHADQTAWLRTIEEFLSISQLSYPEELTNRKINTSEVLEMPEWFKELFSEDIARIVSEVEQEGFSIPDSWSVF